MTIDLFSSTGSKSKQMALPASLFGQPINWGLMHQAVVRQQSNRRQSPAHVLTRSEVSGSTKKLFSQKHTGRARRGDIRSPLLRGGSKAFGPRNAKNYSKDMPRNMRHAALRSSLSAQAGKGIIVGLESFGDAIKTKTLVELLKKMSITDARSVLIVSKAVQQSLVLSARNVPGVTVTSASYLNPESVLHARKIVFLVDAIDEADRLFGKKEAQKGRSERKAKKAPVAAKPTAEKPAVKAKAPAKKKTATAKKASPKKS